mgnify:CR=1 FL=1
MRIGEAPALLPAPQLTSACPCGCKSEASPVEPVETFSSDRDALDPLPALSRPNTSTVVDEMRDDNLARPSNGARRFGHHRHMAGLFTADGNWQDTGTAVAADQYAGFTPGQQAEFLSTTGAKAQDIRPGDAGLMQLSPAKDFDRMDAPKPAITFREIDHSKIGSIANQPRWIVMHYTAGVNDTPDSVWKRFNDLKGIPSTHFVVGKQGDILQCIDEGQICDGTLNFNDEAIQIEVCGDFRAERETDAEFNATTNLVKYLQKKYHIADTQVISHRQVDNNTGNPGRKPDPTFRFMNRLYTAIRENQPEV